MGTPWHVQNGVVFKSKVMLSTFCTSTWNIQIWIIVWRTSQSKRYRRWICVTAFLGRKPSQIALQSRILKHNPIQGSQWKLSSFAWSKYPGFFVCQNISKDSLLFWAWCPVCLLPFLHLLAQMHPAAKNSPFSVSFKPILGWVADCISRILECEVDVCGSDKCGEVDGLCWWIGKWITLL